MRLIRGIRVPVSFDKNDFLVQKPQYKKYQKVAFEDGKQ